MSESCWIITEGIAGTENQCLGLAEALGVSAEVKRVKLRAPWKQLSPWLRWGHGCALAKDSDRIDAPYPDILIASGRKSIGVALHVKKMSGGKTFLVQVQDPHVDPALFDLVVVPAHDRLRGANVLVTAGALHRVTPEKLASEQVEFTALAQLPQPRVAVLIGGTSKNHTMTRADAERLAAQLKGLNASLMVTASRRTGEENAQILRAALSGDNVFFWDGQGRNPYFAMLALADYIVVTEDSVSMASEAVSTGKPVYVAALSGGSPKLRRFHENLQVQGYTRPFAGVLESWSYDPPRDTLKAAQEIRKRMAHVKDA